MEKYFSSGNPAVEPISEESTRRAVEVLKRMAEPEACMYEMLHATRWEPADYCENDAELGEIYCSDHREED